MRNQKKIKVLSMIANSWLYSRLYRLTPQFKQLSYIEQFYFIYVPRVFLIEVNSLSNIVEWSDHDYEFEYFVKMVKYYNFKNSHKVIDEMIFLRSFYL